MPRVHTQLIPLLNRVLDLMMNEVREQRSSYYINALRYDEKKLAYDYLVGRLRSLSKRFYAEYYSIPEINTTDTPSSEICKRHLGVERVPYLKFTFGPKDESSNITITDLGSFTKTIESFDYFRTFVDSIYPANG